MSASVSARESRERRRRAIGWIPYGVMAVVVAAAVVLTIAFNESWWRQAHPAASAEQEFGSQSMFTQAGVDYSGKLGLVKISLAADRPRASQLGLPASGSRTITYAIPLTIEVSGDDRPIRQTLTDTVQLQTSAGRISAVRFTDDRSYSEMYRNAIDVLAATGDSADRTAFDASLEASRNASNNKRYDAVSVTESAGLRARLELKGSPSTAQLTIVLTPS
ncbi:MAG: hypothetical protein QOF36_302 [Microbacteriaceae bacterium]|jgi:hypothetical protein|nr:hypothetical protein [Microbacteriaceae bacterium]